MSDNRDERRRAVELVIAVAVVVISLASLFTAVYQAVVTRQTLEATSRLEAVRRKPHRASRGEGKHSRS